MSYALIVAEVRRGQFEERNLDSIGLCALLGKESGAAYPCRRLRGEASGQSIP